QSCRKNYYLYQTPLFSYLVTNAKKSTTFWLEKALEFMKQKNMNYLPEIQIDGLICHLQDNHSLCWPEVCWIKDNQELKKIFRLPIGQRLVTTYRTSINEAFNRVKLVYLDKKIDFWKSFSGQHALAVIHHNDGYARVLETIRYGYTYEPFTIQDKINIKKMESIRYDQQVRNVKNIYLRNTERAEIYSNKKKELQEFDFAQTYLTNFGVSSTALYASMMETAIHEEKIFEEIAIGGAWGRLGFLKKRYPTVPLLLLTATVSSAHIEAIRKTLNLEQSNFEIIH
ncbi:6178_t:CDS:2, partial [Racocetra persica]